MNNFYLTQLIRLYFNLPKGYIIDSPNLLNFMCKIFDICDVYISNKALKHIVESRRDKDKRDLQYVMEIVRDIHYTLLSPDIVFLNEKSINSIGVVKKINSDKTVNNSVILEYIHTYNHYEIVTAYERDDKDIQKLINIKHLIK